jgi:hypothetical protein
MERQDADWLSAFRPNIHRVWNQRKFLSNMASRALPKPSGIGPTAKASKASSLLNKEKQLHHAEKSIDYR